MSTFIAYIHDTAIIIVVKSTNISIVYRHLQIKHLALASWLKLKI